MLHKETVERTTFELLIKLMQDERFKNYLCSSWLHKFSIQILFYSGIECFR